jgi:hypothetical protein
MSAAMSLAARGLSHQIVEPLELKVIPIFHAERPIGGPCPMR